MALDSEIVLHFLRIRVLGEVRPNFGLLPKVSGVLAIDRRKGRPIRPSINRVVQLVKPMLLLQKPHLK